MANLKTPPASSPAVRRRMRNTPRSNTPVEVEVRRFLHAMGLRYRVDHPIPHLTRSRPDIVFTRRRVAVYIDGCYWHFCPLHRSVPTTNRDWWIAKLQANADRDVTHTKELSDGGWTVLRFWEHEEPELIAASVQSVVLQL
ncbi:MAG: very short patch repair endonuclease [bacterium]|nr:very short patch repair endonuclease [bacterium]